MKNQPVTEGETQQAAKPVPPKGRVLGEGEQPKPHHYAPIAPPPAGSRAPAGHYMTDAKASQLAERGFKMEGYIMRDEVGDVALIHCGKVVWLTPDEMESILQPTSDKVRYSDEEN